MPLSEASEAAARPRKTAPQGIYTTTPSGSAKSTSLGSMPNLSLQQCIFSGSAAT